MKLYNPHVFEVVLGRGDAPLIPGLSINRLNDLYQIIWQIEVDSDWRHSYGAIHVELIEGGGLVRIRQFEGATRVFGSGAGLFKFEYAKVRIRVERIVPCTIEAELLSPGVISAVLRLPLNHTPYRVEIYSCQIDLLGLESNGPTGDDYFVIHAPAFQSVAIDSFEVDTAAVGITPREAREISELKLRWQRNDTQRIVCRFNQEALKKLPRGLILTVSLIFVSPPEPPRDLEPAAEETKETPVTESDELGPAELDLEF